MKFIKKEVCMLSVGRTTITAESLLMKRVEEHVSKSDNGNLTDFYNRAILNQLEKEGDFEIRDLLEEVSKDNA
jgi:hypothetical protein